MEDKKDSNNSPEKKYESPPHKNLIEEDINLINKLNLTEQVPNKIKSKAFTATKLTKEYIEADEEKDINIKYKEHGNKIIAISLDLLLKKIVKENFLEENQIKIYSFCQQCFCFIDKDILFNKIFNCYDFYKKENVNIINIYNLIKFLNILVIEMYEYYFPIINIEDPLIHSLNEFYQLLMAEIIGLINKKEEAKEEKTNSQIDFNSKEFENTIEDKKVFNEVLLADIDKDLISDRLCIFSLEEDTNNQKRDRNNTYRNKNSNDKDIYIKTEPNTNSNTNKKNKILGGDIQSQRNNNNKNKININKNINLKKDSKLLNNTNKKTNSNLISKEEKNGSSTIFQNLKKEKPIKIKNKPEKISDKSLKENTRIKRSIPIKTKEKKEIKEIISPEEEILTEITNIKILFSFEPKKRELEQAKLKLNFYKNLKKNIAEAIGKPIKDTTSNKSRHAMMKSVTLGNLGKKNKVKLHNEKFFNILEWDREEIGEKLISISKMAINKVQRRELYKAIYLKKNKNETSPNVMENIEKFNRLTFFIIQDILSYDFAKDRAKIFEKWITIANYCLLRKDYNDCVAINSALNNYIISGLTKTLNDISKEKKELLKEVGKFIRYQGNYKYIREEMNKLDYNEFYVPYLGMLLKDLAFYEEKSKYIINDTLINFEKIENIQIAIEKFFNFKNAKDKINPVIPDELWFLENLEDLKETELEALADKLEPEFKLYANKKREKRLTNIDKIYFSENNIKKPDTKNIKNPVKK